MKSLAHYCSWKKNIYVISNWLVVSLAGFIVESMASWSSWYKKGQLFSIWEENIAKVIAASAKIRILHSSKGMSCKHSIGSFPAEESKQFVNSKDSYNSIRINDAKKKETCFWRSFAWLLHIEGSFSRAFEKHRSFLP